MFHFLKNIERGGKHAQKPSIVIVLLAFAIFFFFVTSCHFTLLLVIVSDLELHSLISKHAEQKKKNHEKIMHIEKLLDFNMLTASC